MTDCRGWIVRSLAGRDKGTLLCVLDSEGEFFLLADGKRRRAASPKRKKQSHVEVADEGTFGHPAVQKLRSGGAVSDRELRRALAVFRDNRAMADPPPQPNGQGGNHAWQKTI